MHTLIEQKLWKVYEEFRTQLPQPSSIPVDRYEMKEGALDHLLVLDPAVVTEADVIMYADWYTGCWHFGSVDVFRYLFPHLLRVWARQVLERRPSGHDDRTNSFPSHFHALCSYFDVPCKGLPFNLKRLASECMEMVLLEDIRRHESTPVSGGIYVPQWLPDFVSYGVINDRVETLWRRWWQFESVNDASAACFFVSLFLPREAFHGTASPQGVDDVDGLAALLFLDRSEADASSWMPRNLGYVSSTFSAAYFCERLSHALTIAEGSMSDDEHLMLASTLDAVRSNTHDVDGRLELYKYGIRRAIGQELTWRKLAQMAATGR